VRDVVRLLVLEELADYAAKTQGVGEIVVLGFRCVEPLALLGGSGPLTSSLCEAGRRLLLAALTGASALAPASLAIDPRLESHTLHRKANGWQAYMEYGGYGAKSEGMVESSGSASAAWSRSGRVRSAPRSW